MPTPTGTPSPVPTVVPVQRAEIFEEQVWELAAPANVEGKIVMFDLQDGLVGQMYVVVRPGE